MGPDDRSPVLIQRRNLKMARSAHAFVRGSTIRFYEWLESSEARVAPEGPPIWICGDCHVGNLGPVANAKGKIAIQIRAVCAIFGCSEGGTKSRSSASSRPDA